MSEKARTHREAATKAVRAAWSHIFYPEKSETPGKPFDLHQTVVSSRERPTIPEAVYAKARSDGITLGRLGPERLWLALKPILAGGSAAPTGVRGRRVVRVLRLSSEDAGSGGA